MTKNSKQRRFARARVAADANGTSAQYELQRRRTESQADVGGPPADSPEPSRRYTGNAALAQWALLEDLGLTIPDSLPPLGSVFIAEIMESWDFGSHQIRDEDDDSHVSYYEQVAQHVVRLGGWAPGRRAKKLLRTGQAQLSQGDSGVDDGEGVCVEFPYKFTVRSIRQVAVLGNHEEPQDLHNHWVSGDTDGDPHSWDGV